MRKEDFDKTKKELEKEIEKNIKQTYISDERMRMAHVNRFEFKFGETVVFSFVVSFLLSMLFLFIRYNPSVASLLGKISNISYTLIISGASLFAGNTIRKIIAKKCKLKERLKAFTSAKTETEKIEEEMKYKIELEKIDNKNKALEKALDLLSLHLGYTLSNNISNPNKDSKKEIEELSKSLKEKFDELDLLTTKYGVSNIISPIELAIIGAIIGACCSLFILMPLLPMNNYLLLSKFSSLMINLLMVTGFGIGFGYMIKRNHDYKKAFNKLNQNLKENALPKSISSQELDLEIQDKINEISKIIVLIEEEKRIMENNLKDSSTKKQEELTQEKILSIIDESVIENDLINSQIEEKPLSLVRRK